MRCEKELNVERRIFAHPDAIEFLERAGVQFAEAIMWIGAREIQSPITAMRSPAAQEHVVDSHEKDFMAALLRLQHQDESRVLVDVDLLDGVHDDADSETSHTHPFPRE